MDLGISVYIPEEARRSAQGAAVGQLPHPQIAAGNVYGETRSVPYFYFLVFAKTFVFKYGRPRNALAPSDGGCRNPANYGKDRSKKDGPSSKFTNLSRGEQGDRKSTRLNSSHGYISYAV